MQEFTHLEEGSHGHGMTDDKASHAVSEFITVMGHSGFSLLLWALSGFVDRHGAHVEGQDEFYQDNTVEVLKMGNPLYFVLLLSMLIEVFSVSNNFDDEPISRALGYSSFGRR